MEYWNQDMFQRGRLCQICELSHRPLKDTLGEVMSIYSVKVPMAN